MGSYFTLAQSVYITPRTQGPLFALPREIDPAVRNVRQ